MSQVSIIDIEGNHPQIPTQFDADFGSAVPIANVLEILGTTVPAGVLPVYTTGSGNTITTNVQISQAIAASNALNVGLAAFNSAQFTVDANGFVSLTGGGPAIDSIQVDANTAPGTNPVVPNAAGLITVGGAVVVNHGVPLQTRSRAANAYNIEVQYAGSNASSSGPLSGVSHFNNAHFTVDSAGFVSLVGGSLAVDSFQMQTGTSPVVPNGAGLVIFNGAVVAAGTNPVRTDGTGANTMALEVQISQALAATDATKIGLSNFNSAQFSVDANGFVSVKSGGFIWNDVTSATQTVAVQNGYVTDRGGGVTYTLPATAAFGDEFIITGKLGLWTLAQNANQQVTLGSGSTTVGVGGSLAATNLGDSITCVCITGGASTVWRVFASVGNITVT